MFYEVAYLTEFTEIRPSDMKSLIYLPAKPNIIKNREKAFFLLLCKEHVGSTIIYLQI